MENAVALCMMMKKYNYQQIILLSPPRRYDSAFFKSDLKNGRFKIRNKEYGGIKPEKGLWTSTYEPFMIKKHWRHGKDAVFVSEWHEWCFSDMPDWIGRECILLTVMNTAKIFTIDTYEDLKELYKKYPAVKISSNGWGQYEVSKGGFQDNCLDFEKMKKDFDILWLTSNGQSETRMSHQLNLYGWDSESSLMLNNVVQTFKKVPTYTTKHKIRRSYK